jgi:putative transposase
MDKATPAATATPLSCLDADWFDPLEDAVRGQVRAFIEQLLEEELEAALGRGRYERGPCFKGHRNGHRDRRLDTTFGPLVLAVPRARLADDDAGEREWKSELLPAYRRLSRRAELLIAEVYLAGVNTRRVRRALQSLFAGRISKDAVSRAWHRTKSAWEAWQQRDLAGDDIVRLILDGTVVKVRLDRKATAISLLIVLGIRRDGQKVVLTVKNMGGETEAAWRAVLDDLLARGLAKPVGAPGRPPRSPLGASRRSSSLAARGSRRRSPACGTTCRCSAAPCIRSATCSPTRPSTCTMRSGPTSMT